MKIKHIEYIHRHQDRNPLRCNNYATTLKNPLFHRKAHKIVKAMKKAFPDMVVKLRGRHPNRQKFARNEYDKVKFRSDLPLKHAKTVDVYVYEK